MSKRFGHCCIAILPRIIVFLRVPNCKFINFSKRHPVYDAAEQLPKGGRKMSAPASG